MDLKEFGQELGNLIEEESPGSRRRSMEQIRRELSRVGSFGHYLSLNFKRAFSVEVDLYVNLVQGKARVKTVQNMDGDKVQRTTTPYTVNCEVSWAGSTRTVKTARASVNLYNKVVELAEAIEVAVDYWSIETVEEEVIDEPADDEDAA